MITSVNINNIALISHLSLDFDNGLTVLSGETGSGKSIIIDSLAFVLGERADRSMIKHGTDKASVEVSFAISEDSRTAGVLKDLDIDYDDTLVIKRTLTLSGKNECRVNGSVCSTSVLKQITATLVDIFGQSQHLNLLKVDKHIEVLDGFCDFSNHMNNIHYLYAEYKAVNKQLSQFGGSDADRVRQLDILSFQIEELMQANLSIDEEQQLMQSYTRAVNMQRIADALGLASQLLLQEDGGNSAISQASNALDSISKFDQSVVPYVERLNSCAIELGDITSSVQELLSQCAYDYDEVESVNARLEQIKAIKRKYGGDIDSALDFLSKAQQQFELLSNSSEIIATLNKQKQDLIEQLYNCSCRISKIRHESATKLSANIVEQLSQLGMKSTCFEVQFNEEPTLDQYADIVSANGFDRVEFLLSANAGEPLKPLAKVISGGEMSRFMLAIKNITASIENIPTMVFDEIDTGISGIVGQMVAEKLAVVSRNYQCIVITHLPQIVSMADNNLLIAKSEIDGKTQSSVSPLCDVDSKSIEVARLLGGTSKLSVATALEMIDNAERFKRTI